MIVPCGWCGKEVQAADDFWRRATHPWALVIGANYCRASCLLAAHKNPQTAAHVIKSRQPK